MTLKTRDDRPPDPPGDIFTPAQGAAFLQISMRTMMDGLRAGKIPGRKVVGQWRCSKQQLEDYVRGGERGRKHGQKAP